MTWQFILILFCSFAVAAVLGWRQHRAYQAVVNRIAGEEHRAGVALVTGRFKGRLRGAVAVLVLDTAGQTVTRCLVMSGASVFARFRERPELTGPAGEISDAVTDTAARKAVTDALDRYRRMAASAHGDRVPASLQGGGIAQAAGRGSQPARTRPA
jgi:glucitol operon activator protein